MWGMGAMIVSLPETLAPANLGQSALLDGFKTAKMKQKAIQQDLDMMKVRVKNTLPIPLSLDAAGVDDFVLQGKSPILAWKMAKLKS
jgi:hypothetical protein